MNSQMAPEMDSRMASAMDSRMASDMDLFDNVWMSPSMLKLLNCLLASPSILTIKKVTPFASQRLFAEITQRWMSFFACGRVRGLLPHTKTSLNVEGDNLGNFTIEITADTITLREIINTYAQIVAEEAKHSEEADAYLKEYECHNGTRIYRDSD